MGEETEAPRGLTRPASLTAVPAVRIHRARPPSLPPPSWVTLARPLPLPSLVSPPGINEASPRQETSSESRPPLCVITPGFSPSAQWTRASGRCLGTPRERKDFLTREAGTSLGGGKAASCDGFPQTASPGVPRAGVPKKLGVCRSRCGFCCVCACVSVCLFTGRMWMGQAWGTVREC